VSQHNRRHAAMIDAERAVLKALPAQPAMTWEEMTVRVTSASGLMCRHVFYTVPSDQSVTTDRCTIPAFAANLRKPSVESLPLLLAPSQITTASSRRASPS
jgi:hypothetical protein